MRPSFAYFHNCRAQASNLRSDAKGYGERFKTADCTVSNFRASGDHLHLATPRNMQARMATVYSARWECYVRTIGTVVFVLFVLLSCLSCLSSVSDKNIRGEAQRSSRRRLPVKAIDCAQQCPDAFWVNDCCPVIDRRRGQRTPQIH
jgi:hypothetical protein